MIRRGLKSRGFTLLESLVALAIAAIVLNGFYGALSTGSLLQLRADRQADQMLVAATVLDRVGVDLPLRAGTVMQETDRGFAWELVVAGTPPADLTGAVSPGGLLYVSVAVTEPGRDDPPVILRAIRYVGTPL